MNRKSRLKRQQILEAEVAVSHCLVMRLSIAESLRWIQERYNLELSRVTFCRLKKKIDDNVTARLYDIAKGGFLVQHEKRIRTLETIEGELWRLYKETLRVGDNKEAHSILNDLAYVQPYLAAFFESTKAVMEYHGNNMSIENKTQSFDLDDIQDNNII